MLYIEDIEYFDLVVIVNGCEVCRRVPTHQRLLDFLRDDLRLTGTKEVCGEGECGACTVILNGETVNSCLILAVEAHGSEIMTIEGLSHGQNLTDLQQAFIEKHSVQCGYCIPGMVLSAEQLEHEQAQPDREIIKQGLAGNICRCTGYHKIIDAVEQKGDR
ncbi:MAG: (2Fe-2S)-binding protein [Candidatus Marinimicrobia bacterium]|nr:(2Fe-2S)-binding protein [Candidatus Neomarinimicrobiota bacterium]